ncbi:MAG: DNA polymerase I [Gammaproteobacteria bacterium]|nr:DNA polymerase I [Gammaproteobacteria bacterium]MBU1624114.1 DNA polymerase I [Gammaproteobacteria bacterium]MBU1981842.1 DNA polymerase I [Gammaproteobacteria bacterium]
MKTSEASFAKTLLLVDGSSYLYRAFHAMPDLRSPQGEPTGAIQGVLNMLRRLKADFPADYSACVFDAKGKTFRDDWFPEYKANRPSMPDDLRAQVEPLHEVIAAAGWNIIMVDGVEADDVIGTLARQASQNGARCIISTGDKDLTQLVDDNTLWVNTMSEEKLDIAGVIAKFGVPPERIVDYLALVGDTVDNVPGVTKCGPKTAVKWLTEYGTLDNLIARADEVKGAVGNNLRDALEWLPMGKQLVTVKCDVPLDKRFDELAAPAADTDKLKAMYERFGFRSLMRELTGESAPKKERATSSVAQRDFSQPEPPQDLFQNDTSNYEAILTEAQLEAWQAKLMAAPLVSLDTETTGLDPMVAQLVGISLAITPHEAAYLPLAHHYPGAPDQIGFDRALAMLKPWLESDAHKKLGQNLKYDQHIFANHGIALRGIAEDTLLQSYVIESHKPHEMGNLALRHLGMSTISYTDVAGKGAKQIGFDQVDVETATKYAAEDADITLQLHQTLSPQLQGRLAEVYRDIEMPVREVLFKMERNGVLIDSGKLSRQSHELGLRLNEIEKQAFELAGQPFNLASPKQLQEILFDKLGIPSKKKTATGARSTDEEVLQELALDYPLPKLLLEHRGMAKLKSTYTDKLPLMVNAKTGRVHTSYSQAVAVTGRLSSSEPNLQNIPVRTPEGRRIREAFIAPAGSHIISADYSQIELRIMAHLSGDEGLLKAFAAGEDIHRATAAEVFNVSLDAVSSEQRRYAKVINFGLIYGMSAYGLASQLGIENSAAKQYIDVYFARYPGVKHYMDDTREQAKAQGFVETWFGRRLWLPEINGANGMRRQAAERAAINAPMQGTAADLIKLAMIAVQDWLEQEKLETKMIMQVHDELVLEVPDAELSRVKEKVRELMCGVAELKVPLEVGLGEGMNWDEAH